MKKIYSVTLEIEETETYKKILNQRGMNLSGRLRILIERDTKELK